MKEPILYVAFIEAISLLYLQNKNIKLMLCGDFNFDSTKLRLYPLLKLMLELFNELSVICCDDLDINKDC